jgi:galactose mutarotase-like enzyme
MAAKEVTFDERIPEPIHHATLVRIYDENDEMDMEIVTSEPYLFSVTFREPRALKAFSLEPGAIPVDVSFKNR